MVSNIFYAHNQTQRKCCKYAPKPTPFRIRITRAMNTRGPSTYDPARERVYLDFYNLDEAPFSITPDPEYLFYSVTHQNAINKLLYGINSRMGFLLLVGEVGTGKTTFCRSLLDNPGSKGLYSLYHQTVPVRHRAHFQHSGRPGCGASRCHQGGFKHKSFLPEFLALAAGGRADIGISGLSLHQNAQGAGPVSQIHVEPPLFGGIFGLIALSIMLPLYDMISEIQ